MARALRERIGKVIRNKAGRLIQGPWVRNLAGKNPDQLVDDFIKANDTHRLHMYLQHRDLRPVFAVVSDLDDPADPALLRVELKSDLLES
jgi:hypothetical protein